MAAVGEMMKLFMAGNISGALIINIFDGNISGALNNPFF